MYKLLFNYRFNGLLENIKKYEYQKYHCKYMFSQNATDGKYLIIIINSNFILDRTRYTVVELNLKKKSTALQLNLLLK